MTKHPANKTAEEPRDYLPAAGRDALLPFYDRFTAAVGVRKLHRALIGQAGLAAGQRVLEIGCGTGNLTIGAKRAHPQVEFVGSDPDPRALARAERKARDLRGIRFERAYAQRLPYPDDSFDRVLSALMLHHLDNEARTAAAAEVRRVLRPGGSLHLVDFTGLSHGAHGAHGAYGEPRGDVAQGGQRLHGFLARRVLKSAQLGENTGGGISRLLTAAGLDCCEVASQRHPIFGAITYYRAVHPVDQLLGGRDQLPVER